MNPWPNAIRLVLGLAVVIGVAVSLHRMSVAPGDSELPVVDESQLRVAAFNEVYADLEAGVARPRAWKQSSGRIVLPGIEAGECRGWIAVQDRRQVVNDPPWSGFGSPPLEQTFDYVRLYNDTLKNVLLSRYGACDERVLTGN